MKTLHSATVTLYLLRSIILTFILFTVCSVAYGGGGPRNVLIVINMQSEASKAIGLYYQRARGIPLKNICYINCSTAEIVSKTECENRIREPIRRFLQIPGLVGTIDYIVLTKGIPLGANGYKTGEGCFSVTSILTCVDNPDIQMTFVSPYGPSGKGVYGVSAPERYWSHSTDFFGYHYYLVTRLDALTVDQVKLMIDRSVQPDKGSHFLLDKIPYAVDYFYYANNRLGTGVGSAYEKLKTAGLDVICDTTSTFVSGKSGLMGYFGWGSNDGDYTYAKFTSNSFVPGSIADSYYSFSARTFTRPVVDNSKRDSLIGYLFEQGLCAAGGYVSEPGITTATFPNVLFDRYIKGYNVAESFYMAGPQSFWKTVIVGDPLMAPYATRPQITLGNMDKPLTGNAQIEATASDESGIDRVDFFLDGQLIGTANTAPYILNIDTTRFSVGQHPLEAIAYENTPVHTQASANAIITIVNDLPPDAHLDQVIACLDGQNVMLTNNLVVMGTQVVGDGFYLEEKDRSFGLKVVWKGSVATGDIVDFSGTVSTVNGERCVVASDVKKVSRYNSLPRPLYISLNCIGGGPFNAYTPGYAGVKGLRNFGLRAKVVGVVTHATPDDFFISNGNKTAKTLHIQGPFGESPAIGKLVAVIGVVGSEQTSEGPRPTLLVQDQRDIQVLR